METEISSLPNKILDRTISKRLNDVDGIKYWLFKSGDKRLVPEISDRVEIVKKVHVDLNHRAVLGTYHEVKKIYYWPGIKKTIENVIKRCETCNIVNRKRKTRIDFVETNRRLEIFAIDVLQISHDTNPILIGIDYYTRFAIADVIEAKTAEHVIRKLDQWFDINKPETLVTDHGKEFSNKCFTAFCRSKSIDHHPTSVESHQSNGRVERLIRTIRESLLKTTGENIHVKLKYVIDKYNETVHSSTGTTPWDAWRNPENAQLIYRNSRYGMRRVANPTTEPQLKVGDCIRISRENNQEKHSKDWRKRFTETGSVKACLTENSYIVRKSSGRYVKKNLLALKGVLT